MRIIVLGSGSGSNRTFSVPAKLVKSAPFIGLAMFLLAGAAGFGLAKHTSGVLPDELVAVWQHELIQLSDQANALSTSSEEERRAYATRLAELQARMLRLEAVSERLAGAANLDAGEFNFDALPAMGGPLEPEALEDLPDSPLDTALDDLQRVIEDRERQLDVMERLFLNRSVVAETAVQGRPVSKGYISSGYGSRTDPIDGEKRFHRGLDFSAPSGTRVVAAASGVVTYAGRKPDYGYTIEIRHSDGYTTRYAHNSENLVKAGDLVKKGEDIAVVGSTGRSTGTHLHFEVHQDGRSVNPLPFVRSKRG